MIGSRAVAVWVLSASVFAIGCTAAGPETTATEDPTAPGIPGAKGAKGDKGDTGAMGATGATGATGDQGDAGATGATGLKGLAGIDGIDGIDGVAGVAGVKGDKGDPGTPAGNSLIKVTALAKGDSNCPGGGLKVEVGVDDNNNASLDPSEVDQTSFACQAVPRLRVAFVTSQTYDGNLGGVAGGDAKCQASADAVPALAGKTFKAWLSDAVTEPAATFTSDGAFVNTNGVVLADSYADFRDTALMARMATETGAPLATFVWTGTDENGSRAPYRCDEWTTADAGALGAHGNSALITWYWSFNDWMTCDNLASLYCVEQ